MFKLVIRCIVNKLQTSNISKRS